MADKNWDKMMTDWQSCKIANTNDVKDLEDIKILESKTRRKARSMNFFMWGDIIGAVIMCAVFFYQLILDDSLYLQIIFGGALVIILPMTFPSIWLRKGTWQATGDDTKAYLTLALKRSISAVNLAKASAIAAVLAGPFFSSVILWHGLTHEENPDWPLNRFFFGIIFQITLFTAMYIGSRWYQKRKQLEQEKLKAMLQELETDLS